MLTFYKGEEAENESFLDGTAEIDVAGEIIYQVFRFKGLKIVIDETLQFKQLPSLLNNTGSQMITASDYLDMNPTKTNEKVAADNFNISINRYYDKFVKIFLVK